MTDAPSEHILKIKESFIVFTTIDIVAAQQTREWIKGRTDGRTNERRNEWTDNRRNESNEWKNERSDEWKNERAKTEGATKARSADVTLWLTEFR